MTAVESGARAALAYAGGVLVFAVSLAAASTVLPDRVPLHFDVHGDPDRWASRGGAVVTIGVIGGGAAAVLGLLALLTPRIPVGMFNVPERDWWAATPERERELRRRMRTDVLGFGGGLLVFFAVLTWLTVRAARADPPHLDAWFFVALGCFLVGTLGWVGYAVRVRYRPPTDADGPLDLVG